MRNHRPIQKNTEKLKRGLAQMLKGGVIMDVVTAEQAKIAEDSGAVAVMALERVPADIRSQGGVARMSDPKLIREIMKAVTIPVMAKVRIGHFAEAQILQALGIDYIDESEVLTPADSEFHINKLDFRTPFVCGARDLGEALRRIHEGASMIRTKGEAGTGNVVEAVRHMRRINSEIKALASMNKKQLSECAAKMRVGVDLVEAVVCSQKIKRDAPPRGASLGRSNELASPRLGLVVNFAAGGIATPADAALMMQLGAEGIFVGSGIFKSENPKQRASAIVEAVMHFDNPDIVARVSEGLGGAMESKEISKLEQLYAERGV